MMAGPSMRARMRTAPAAGRPGLDVDPEDPLEALRPGHRGTAFGYYGDTLPITPRVLR